MNIKKEASIKSLKVSNQTRSQFLMLQAQSGLGDAEVFSAAINLMYNLLPSSKDSFVDLCQISSDVLTAQAKDSADDGFDTNHEGV